MIMEPLTGTKCGAIGPGWRGGATSKAGAWSASGPRISHLSYGGLRVGYMLMGESGGRRWARPAAGGVVPQVAGRWPCGDWGMRGRLAMEY